MSEQDQDAIILKVVKDARDARNELAMLREKARLICDAMQEVLVSLRHQIGDVQQVHRAHLSLDDAFRQIPSGAELRELSERLRQAAETDADLTKRKERLGI